MRVRFEVTTDPTEAHRYEWAAAEAAAYPFGDAVNAELHSDGPALLEIGSMFWVAEDIRALLTPAEAGERQCLACGAAQMKSDDGRWTDTEPTTPEQERCDHEWRELEQ